MPGKKDPSALKVEGRAQAVVELSVRDQRGMSLKGREVVPVGLAFEFLWD